MRKKLLEAVEKSHLRSDVPAIKIGDMLRLMVRIKEGSKERQQRIEGIVIADDGIGTNRTVTIRKVSSGIGVEMMFPVHSPMIASFKIMSPGKPRVRRAKLYYLRKVVGRMRIRYDRTSQ